jgi:hypothetical protein
MRVQESPFEKNGSEKCYCFNHLFYFSPHSHGRNRTGCSIIDHRGYSSTDFAVTTIVVTSNCPIVLEESRVILVLNLRMYRNFLSNVENLMLPNAQSD